MAINEKLTQRVREVLESCKFVEEKNMFSGITFMVNGKMCISVRDERIMCRIDPALHEKIIEEYDCRPVFMKGREYKGFVYVDEEFLKTKKSLNFWVSLCLDYNAKAKAAKKSGKRK